MARPDPNQIARRPMAMADARISLTGPNHPEQGYLGEASLDVEFLSAVGLGVPTAVYSMKGTGFDLLGWAEAVGADAKPGVVHSVSWGSPESNYNASWMFRVDTGSRTSL